MVGCNAPPRAVIAYSCDGPGSPAYLSEGAALLVSVKAARAVTTTASASTLSENYTEGALARTVSFEQKKKSTPYTTYR